MKLKGKITAMAAAFAVLLLTIPFIVGTVTAGELTVGASHNFGGDIGVEYAYSISSVQNLKDFAEMVNGGKTDINGYLTTNIDMTGVTDFVPIGTSDKPYIGKFDGCGKIISKLVLSDTTAYRQGLFGYIGEGGLVENVGLEDSSISGCDYVGGIAGYSAGTVQSCYNTSEIIGNTDSSYYAGGIVGYNSGTVQNCYNTHLIKGYYYVGGIAGYNGGTVKYCYSIGYINGSGMCGLAVGQQNGTISYCYYNKEYRGANNYNGACGTDDSESVLQGLTTLNMTGTADAIDENRAEDMMSPLFTDDNSGVWTTRLMLKTELS